MHIFWDIPEAWKSDAQMIAALNLVNESLGLFVCHKRSKAVPALTLKPGEISQTIAPADKDNRFNVSTSFLREIGETLRCGGTPDSLPHRSPFLDQQIKEFYQSLQEYFVREQRFFVRKYPWAFDKPFAVALTQDVDLTRKYGLKQLGKFLVTGKLRDFGRGAAEFISGRNSYWNFSELLNIYRQNEWRATFFFLARSREGKGYRYNISHRKFRRLFAGILAEGHRIGLHSSRFAFDFPERISGEKEKLERILKNPVTGVRQHFLRLTFPQAWDIFRQAGFRYDSSCGFNEINGFKAGTSFPFRAFDWTENVNYDLYEIPFSIMDYPLVEQETDFDRGWAAFQDIAEKVQGVNGLLNLLWHPSNLAEPAFRPYWDATENWLRNTDCFQTHLEGLMDWWEKRNGVQLDKIIETNGGMELVLSAPQGVRGLTLEICSPGKIWSLYKNAVIVPVSDSITRIIIQQLHEGENRLRFSYY